MRIYVWEARQKRGLTLQQLEKLTGISRSTINRIENGQTVPRLDQLEKIRVAHGLFPFQKIIRIQAEGIKLRFSLSNNSATARVRNQRESVQIICDTLNAA